MRSARQRDEWKDHPPLVADDFEVPAGYTTEEFRLEPLAARHNVAHHRAWTSSIGQIQATPGFRGRAWPQRPVSVGENAFTIAAHASHFSRRVGFTYAVCEPSAGELIGCVYLYPSADPGHDVEVRSWVSAAHSDLDAPLRETVTKWLEAAWPFAAPDYASHGG